MKKWKKNLRKIPPRVRQRLQVISADNVVAACVRALPKSAIDRGDFAHLGIVVQEESVKYPTRFVPPAELGAYSRWNIEGREIVRRDLPKVIKWFTFEVPNFGDWSKGTHDVDIPREVYEREFIAAQNKELSLDLLRTEDGDDPVYLFCVRVEDVLSRSETDFEGQLFENLNLLQENIGAVDVFAADTTDQTYLGTISVYWEILPPGHRSSTLARILSKFKRPTEEVKKRLVERYELLESMHPLAYISGTGGFQRYFGAMFLDDLVVFENLEHGNAIYVMFNNWEELSKMSRTELLASRRSDFVRIVHREGWESRLRSVVSSRLRSAA